MKESSIKVQAPGRINIIGEHTDYNEGFVLPAAIDKKTIFHLSKNGTEKRVNIHAADLEERFSFDLKNFQAGQSGWQNLVMGVIHELNEIGATLKGFDSRFEGDVPIGAGMSSSASLTCSLAFGLNQLFDLGLSEWQLIRACQFAEHHYTGTECGIMDQFASIMGKKNQAMLLDCRSLKFEYFPLDLGQYELLLLNTNNAHNLSSSEYNSRRKECEEGVAIFQNYFPDLRSLRDATYPMLMELGRKMPQSVLRRCRHVILENGRVLEATAALEKKDFYKLGVLMYQSHFSLKKDYEVSCSELDFLVNQTLNKEYILGSRMMGGGFGGCTLNVIDKKQTSRFIELVAKNYHRRFGIELTPYHVTIVNGAGVL